MKSMMINVRILFVLAMVMFFSFVCHSQVIVTIAGTGTAGYNGDGIAATAAEINEPMCIALDSLGNLFFADRSNHRVRKIDTTGIIYTIAGNGTAGYSADGLPATDAELYTPYGVFIDKNANVFICDQSPRVRKINAGGIITTIAGNGTLGYTGDGIPATTAEFSTPDGVAVDGNGNVYVADIANNRVRRIDTVGIIYTFAGIGPSGGLGSYTGDGIPATTAGLSYPTDVAIGPNGDIFIADLENYRTRRVDASGDITTYAGSGLAGATGDGGPATACKLEYASGIAIDEIGNLYIADVNANLVRKVNRSGIINTIAGTGAIGYFGDGGPATAAKLSGPSNIAIDIYGDVFISDTYNHRIREIKSGNHLPSFIHGHAQTINVCEHAAVSLDSLLAIDDVDTGQPEIWTPLSGPFHGSAVVSYTTPSTGGTIFPVGLSYTSAPGYSGGDTLTIRIDDGYSVYVTAIYINVANNPHAGIVSGVDSLCAGGHATLSDTTVGGAWFASNASATVSSGYVTGISPGIDTLYYVVSNACGSDTAAHVDTIHWCPDDVKMISNTPVNSVIIYPNATTGDIYIDGLSDVNIKVYNMTGQLVKEAAHSDHISISGLPSGWYFVRVFDMKGTLRGQSKVLKK